MGGSVYLPVGLTGIEKRSHAGAPSRRDRMNRAPLRKQIDLRSPSARGRLYTNAPGHAWRFAIRVSYRRPLANRGPRDSTMQTTRTAVSDAKDTARKVSFVRSMAAGYRDGKKFAQAIAADPTLLRGLAVVLRKLARNPEARTILDKVFERHARQFPSEYRAYAQARLTH